MRCKRKANSYEFQVGSHTMQRGTNQSIYTQFFSEQNELSLFTNAAQEIQQRQGIQINERQQNRLGKTLEHFMKEVWDVNGPMPIQQLNREVLNASMKDFSGYLRRESAAPSLSASERIVSDPVNQPRMEMASQRLAIQQGLPVQPRPTFESNLLMDTGTRFEQLQNDRIPSSSARPTVPDFQITLSSSGDEPSAVSLFESAKKAREAEASRTKAITGTSESDANPLVRFMSQPSSLNDPQSNPTLAQPLVTIAPTPRSSLPQDFIIKQDDIINYRDTEYNLFLYSADRDWYNNTRENRYTFTVNFDVGNNKQGFNFSPSATKKFKNISRIELVKAIVPTEGIENLITRVSGPAFNSSTRINILTYPYIVVRIPELDGNNYGTDNNLDNAFGVLQYDANWTSDATNLTDGFLAMIPKFMKCQKVYQPTPLATLTKLTIELQKPDGTSISDVSDTLTVQNIYISGAGGGGINAPSPPSGIVSSLYKAVQTISDGTNNNGDYLFVQTTTYFSQWAFTEGNRIQFQGLNASQVPSIGAAQSSVDLVSYLQQDGGLQLVAIAFTATGAADGANNVGYANVLIFRTPHSDPTTGAVTVKPFGGTTPLMNTLATNLNGVAVTATTFTGAKLINLTHQTNVVLRIITRELDPAARVRPDNL